MSSSKKTPFKITKEGSLGLLALGDIGLRAWRKVKRQANTNNDLNEKE